MSDFAFLKRKFHDFLTLLYKGPGDFSHSDACDWAVELQSIDLYSFVQMAWYIRVNPFNRMHQKERVRSKNRLCKQAKTPSEELLTRSGFELAPLSSWAIYQFSYVPVELWCYMYQLSYDAICTSWAMYQLSYDAICTSWAMMLYVPVELCTSWAIYQLGYLPVELAS